MKMAQICRYSTSVFWIALLAILLQYCESNPLKRSLLYSDYEDNAAITIGSLVEKPEDHLPDATSPYPVWQKEAYPNPQESPRCGRSANSFICDPDKILTDDEASNLDVYIRRVRANTPCLCSNKTCTAHNNEGVTIGIALMRNMYTSYAEEPDIATLNFAKYLRESWKMGKCDDDILIIVALNNQQGGSEVGPTTKPLLPQETADEIFLHCRGHFSNGHFYQGLEAMVASFEDVLLGMQRTNFAMTRDLTNPEESEDDDDGMLTGGIIGIAVAVLILVAVVVVIGVLVRKRMTGEHEKFHLGKLGHKKDSMRPVSVNPISSPGGVYEPCSTEDNGETNNSLEKPPNYYEGETMGQITDEENEDDLKRPRGLSAVEEETEDENHENSDKEIPEGRPRAHTEADVEKVDIHSARRIQRIGEDEIDVKV